MPCAVASCLTPCSQVAKSPPHGAALAVLANAASHSSKTIDLAARGRRMKPPRTGHPGISIKRRLFLEAKDGKVRAAILHCQGWLPRQPGPRGIGLFRRGNTGKPCATALELGRAMIELLQFVSYLLTIYVYIVIAMAILSWLIAFNVVNTRNQIVHMIAELLYRLTEPALRPIRNVLPNMGGIDISPIILFLIILFIQSVILPNIAKLFI